MHNIVFLFLYENVQHSAKFVFYPSIWTIYNVFSEYQQDFSLMLTL